MNFRIFLFLLLFMQFNCATGMQSCDNKIVYRTARQEDLDQLLELINTQAVYDRDKIVILPNKFRAGALQAGINKNRYFVAEANGKIIGYKKLFLMADEKEKEDVLVNEIRCIDNEHNCTFAGIIGNDDLFEQDGSIPSKQHFDLCIYNGGDFTCPAYRGKGINKQLTNQALLSLIEPVRQQIQEKKASAITMLFGLTKANAGEYPGAFADRTPSIVKSFRTFLNEFENCQSGVQLLHNRYRAFMPTFDPESQECVPLDDKHSVSGFGCILTHQMKG